MSAVGFIFLRYKSRGVSFPILYTWTLVGVEPEVDLSLGSTQNKLARCALASAGPAQTNMGESHRWPWQQQSDEWPPSLRPVQITTPFRWSKCFITRMFGDWSIVSLEGNPREHNYTTCSLATTLDGWWATAKGNTTTHKSPYFNNAPNLSTHCTPEENHYLWGQ